MAQPLLVAVLCTAALALAAVVEGAAVAGDPPPDGGGGLTSGYRAGYDAVVGDPSTCGPASGEPCPYTHVHIRTPGDWDDPDVREIVTSRLVDLATGAAVSTSAPVFHGGPAADGDGGFDPGPSTPSSAYRTNSYLTLDTASRLAPGAYRLEASYEYPAHWACSVENHPQCVWAMTMGWTGEWRFRYDGATKLVLPMYQPATTALTHKVRRRGPFLVARGRVLTAVVDPVSFRLGPVRPTPRARVKVWTLKGRRWVRRTTVATRADGTFRARVRQRTRTLIKVSVQPTRTYPTAGYATVYRR